MERERARARARERERERERERKRGHGSCRRGPSLSGEALSAGREQQAEGSGCEHTDTDGVPECRSP
eukprot:3679410-Rhodomonas_salina.1